MLGYPSYNEEIDHEEKKHNAASTGHLSGESIDREETATILRSGLDSDTSQDDSISLGSRTHPQTQGRSHHNSVAKAGFPIPSDSLSNPLAKEPIGADADAMVVDSEGRNDLYRLMNWPSWKRVITTILYGIMTSWITSASPYIRPACGKLRMTSMSASRYRR